MKSYKNITEYMKDVPKEHREYVKTLRELSKKLVPKGEEAIRYGMPTMQIDGKNLAPLCSDERSLRILSCSIRYHRIQDRAR
jgi:uncharacterized protein YdhG (YjbR/CyaY superfamily)